MTFEKTLWAWPLALLLGAASAQEIPRNIPMPPAPAAPEALPTVVLMSYGGTIASRGTPRLNITNYGGKGVPRVDPQNWLDDLPELKNVANIVLDDQRGPPDAPQAVYADQVRIAARMNALARDPSVHGIVLTHGTNSMAETAYYLDLVVKTDKPIVLVGSQRPWTGLSGDGPRNLYDAVRVAASDQARGKGVLQVMNQLINPARDVNKGSAYRVNAFQGIDVGAIGFADPDKVVFLREPLRRHTVTSEFAGRDYPKLPVVEIAYAYRDAPGYPIDAMVAHGAKGIVVDGTGAGSPTASQTEAIKRAQAKGVVVVATARTRGGRVQDTPRRREADIVPGDNLTPEKARILLQLALSKTRDTAEIKRIFDEY
ncbi:asparaginase [Pseudoxanthomonas winnipegensis]|uniref:asparaginase n=1 Tax=Pseudoxanthomonas winnipegensis TaxID=2480810 RepID=UPI0030F3F6FF